MNYKALYAYSRTNVEFIMKILTPLKKVITKINTKANEGGKLAINTFFICLEVTLLIFMSSMWLVIFGEWVIGLLFILIFGDTF